MAKPEKFLSHGAFALYNPEYVKMLEQTLKDIADPIAKLQRDAERNNGDLNSHMAIQLVKDPELYRRWAKEAING